MGQSATRKKKKKLLEAQNLNIDSKRFSRKENVSPVNVFLFETLHITHRKHICLSQAVILSSTRNFVATIATLCNKHATSSQKCDYNVYIFRLRQHSNGPLRKHRLSSAGLTGHVCRFRSMLLISFRGNYD